MTCFPKPKQDNSKAWSRDLTSCCITPPIGNLSLQLTGLTFKKCNDLEGNWSRKWLLVRRNSHFIETITRTVLEQAPMEHNYTSACLSVERGRCHETDLALSTRKDLHYNPTLYPFAIVSRKPFFLLANSFGLLQIALSTGTDFKPFSSLPDSACSATERALARG